MIFVRDKGQMCNNILQYGHMYAWGREHGRQTVSMRFAYKYQYFRICQTKYHWFVTYLFAKWGAALHLIPRVTFPFEAGCDTSQQEAELLKHNLVVAEGWRVEFPDLFLKYKPEILQLFQFKKKIHTCVQNKMKTCDNNYSLRLGVHIRRGDYARWNDGKYFFSDDVYASFINEFMALHPEEKVAVFISTNDAEVKEDTFRRLCHTSSIYQLKGNPGEDLCMLSECDYIIGPPSTFSLVASMYHDAKIHWMFSSEADTLRNEGFQQFNDLFTRIL